jgi:hypothetical protein
MDLYTSLGHAGLKVETRHTNNKVVEVLPWEPVALSEGTDLFFRSTHLVPHE